MDSVITFSSEMIKIVLKYGKQYIHGVITEILHVWFLDQFLEEN